jgi:hypothetical protein
MHVFTHDNEGQQQYHEACARHNEPDCANWERISSAHQKQTIMQPESLVVLVEKRRQSAVGHPRSNQSY